MTYRAGDKPPRVWREAMREKGAARAKLIEIYSRSDSGAGDSSLMSQARA